MTDSFYRNSESVDVLSQISEIRTVHLHDETDDGGDGEDNGGDVDDGDDDDGDHDDDAGDDGMMVMTAVAPTVFL